MYISSHAINMYFPIVQNIRFCSQWWQPKDPKRMVFLLPFVGRPMDSQNKGRHQRCPSVEPCVRDGSWGGKPVLKTRVSHTKTNRKGLKNGAWKNHPLSLGESESWHLKCYFWVTMLTLPFFGPCGSCGTTISQRLLLWKIKEYINTPPPTLSVFHASLTPGGLRWWAISLSDPCAKPESIPTWATHEECNYRRL